jgi:CMP-N,N'-diacetyllegionaminic acid synthase
VNILGIIPARGGSKGVRRKNVRPVASKPLIAYAIEAAAASAALTRWVVSTEDDEIAAVSRQLGADVIPRPAALARDDTPMVPVLVDAMERTGGGWDAIVVLQPTTPLRTAKDIDDAIALLDETGADSVVSVYLVEDHHPTRMYTLDGGRLAPYANEPAARLRQALPPVYHRNGAVYACRADILLNQRTLIGEDTRPLVMPRERSINIDDELDLAFANFVLSSGS